MGRVLTGGKEKWWRGLSRENGPIHHILTPRSHGELWCNRHPKCISEKYVVMKIIVSNPLFWGGMECRSVTPAGEQ